MSPSPREPWPEHVKAEALAIAADESYAAASAATHVPVATIRSWASRAHKALDLVGVEVVIPDGLTWKERRDLLLDAYVSGAQEATGACRAAMSEDRPRDAKDLAIVCGILTDKALLLGGGATSRTESFTVTAAASEYGSKLDDDIEALLDGAAPADPAELEAKAKALDREAELLEAELAQLEGGDDG